MITEKEGLCLSFSVIYAEAIRAFFLGVERWNKRKLGNGEWEFWMCKQEMGGEKRGDKQIKKEEREKK